MHRQRNIQTPLLWHAAQLCFIDFSQLRSRSLCSSEGRMKHRDGRLSGGSVEVKEKFEEWDLTFIPRHVSASWGETKGRELNPGCWCAKFGKVETARVGRKAGLWQVGCNHPFTSHNLLYNTFIPKQRAHCFSCHQSFLFIDMAGVLKISVSLASKSVMEHFLSQEGLCAFIVV